MVEHPWMRIPQIANMLGLVLVGIGVIIANIQIKHKFEGVFSVIGIISLIIFFFLLILYLVLAIRDYRELYPKFTRYFLFKWLKY